MKLALLIFSLAFFPLRSESALEYSKLEFPGCPENAFCKKNTGEVRQKWIEELDQFIKNKISESIFNQNLQKNHGMPVASWALEEASILPNIVMWDSPCSQHKKEASKFYISEIFKKNLKEPDLKDSQSLSFSRAYGIGVDKKIFSVIIPYKEEPTFLALAKEFELFPLKITRVKGTPTTEIKRSLLAFSRNETTNFPTDELIIETARHIYTPEYIELTKNFYLKM